MRYTILGFNQELAVELNLDLTDLLLLDYIQRANGNPNMTHIVENEISYVWLSHEKLHEDLPIISISEGTLKNRLSKLKEKDLIQSIQIANKSSRGSKSYYSITELTTSLQNDVVDENERPRHFKMTSNNKLFNISTNVDIENNISKDILLQPNMYDNVSDKLYDDKSKKKKRKNLFEKCVDAINEYTDDLELEDLLVTYLKMRLEVKEKPLYYNMWRGLLNKLFSLSKNLSDLCNIVQQSIDKGWLSFYELKTFNGKKKDLQVISSEFGSVTCNKADDEEMTDAYF